MNTTRPERAAALEAWADRVDTDDLVPADTNALRAIAGKSWPFPGGLFDVVTSVPGAQRWRE